MPAVTPNVSAFFKFSVVTALRDKLANAGNAGFEQTAKGEGYNVTATEFKDAVTQHVSLRRRERCNGCPVIGEFYPLPNRFFDSRSRICLRHLWLVWLRLADRALATSRFPPVYSRFLSCDGPRYLSSTSCLPLFESPQRRIAEGPGYLLHDAWSGRRLQPNVGC
jgi:hypothetical protein